MSQLTKNMLKSRPVEQNRPVMTNSEIDPTCIVTNEFWDITLSNVNHAKTKLFTVLISRDVPASSGFEV